MRVLKLAVMGVVMLAMLGIGVDGGQLGFGAPAYARHHRRHKKHRKHARKRHAKRERKHRSAEL